MWTWNESGGSPPCIRVFRTALAFEPAAPATAWLTISMPGWLFSKMAYIAFRPASSPPVVHQENISRRPPGLPEAAGFPSAGLAAAGAVVAAGAAGLVSAGFDSAGFAGSAGLAGAAGWDWPHAANRELPATRPVAPNSVFRNVRRSRRRSREEPIDDPSG